MPHSRVAREWTHARPSAEYKRRDASRRVVPSVRLHRLSLFVWPVSPPLPLACVDLERDVAFPSVKATARVAASPPHVCKSGQSTSPVRRIHTRTESGVADWRMVLG